MDLDLDILYFQPPLLSVFPLIHIFMYMTKNPTTRLNTPRYISLGFDKNFLPLL
jgi:hypothetical protein